MTTTPPGADDDRPTMYINLEPAPAQRRLARGAVPDAPVLLADEFFLIAHDDQSGRPRLHHTAITHGLAAALLGELAFAGRLTFDRGHVQILDRRPPGDPLQHLVLDRLVAESRYTATRTWLAYLAADSYEQVARRLWQVGKVEPQQHRRLWRTTTVHVPTDMNVAAWSWARLSTKLRQYEELSPFDLALAGIAASCRLDQFILDGAPYAVGAHLRRLLAAAPKPLHELRADLDTAIGNAVLSHRT
ncbi:GOLPH3/VPS74 family protein [Micromonospora chalcea]|uniref:GOLPH3/VPS74 family protein n=1 Tax=Micromonospora chalcea TaxID=1874 RepID=UPI0016575E93|nr:GPP34 family phosphoprotein [Micromonospora chalcea]MBC8991536.1 GPP34 family phosphoprotein [Micromonospora chalcea]